MPIKFSKGFPRRKSSGNVLDEAPSGPKHSSNESTSSFRVLPRPNSTGKSLDSGSASRSMTEKPLPPARSSFEEDSEDLFAAVRTDVINRGSGATANSLSTLPYDSAASSTRYSNSSTNPSSVDSGSGRNVKAVGQRSHDENSNARGSFLKNAGRTFSFGMTKHNHKETNETAPPIPPIPSDRSRRTTVTDSRDRTMTVSSVTTATPPQLDDSSFSIKQSDDDDFGNMFAQMGAKSSRENLTSRPAPGKSAVRASVQHSPYVNSHVPADNYYSRTAPSSKDGFISTQSPSRTVMQASPQPSALRNMTQNSVLSDNSIEENMFEDTPLHRSPEPVSARTYSSHSSRPPPSSFPTAPVTRVRTQSNGASSIQHSDLDVSEFGAPLVDQNLMASAKLATQYEENAHSPRANPNKIMTPAEFEKYRQHKEETRRYNKVFGRADSDNEGSGDEYEDDEDDEREREKLAVKQRKKQEAHLTVYRQQMMKVTGDAPNTEQPRPATSMGVQQGASSSQLELNMTERRMSFMGLDNKQPTFGMVKDPADEEDEDDDVPLGILAAHGFPNKNRPPTRLAGSSSNPNLRNIAQTQGGTSVVGGESNRGSLPAFARHLPPDPYYGASLVHQAERAPLAMHASTSQSYLPTQPQASGAATAHPLHPAGLVGVIAGEERARAMRRGSPNPPTGPEMPMMGVPPAMRGMPQNMPGFPGPGMMMPPQHMLSPAEQAQLQMSQSMTQMMQMQMQWMQQMQQMNGMMGQNPNMQMPMGQMPGVPQMPGMPQMPQAHLMPQMSGPQMPQMPQLQQNGSPMMSPQPNGMPHRPQSVPLQNANGGGHRMSTLSPSMAGWNHSSPAVPQLGVAGSVYAHSIAPSERSNIGLASRYRPVSTVQAEPEPRGGSWQKRASTFTTSSFRPWANENNNSKSGMATIRSVGTADDDDDEQGWAEMKARKEKKQKSWKSRKGGSNTLQELYNAPA